MPRLGVTLAKHGDIAAANLSMALPQNWREELFGASTDTLARRALEAEYNFAAVKTGTDYERFVANLLAGAGIAAVRVGGSGDYGADLLVETAAGKAVIQCKFYSHPVGYDAVKEAYAAKAINKASAAFVVSNAAFTTQARRTARRLGVTLTNHCDVMAMLEKSRL